ncbi:hypothetical protein ACGFI4_05935 [Micromonospora carbonacea]|uniref:hypothetical protein n=1 Tax=Micromonospora carbonacea TaxID=47853 RepID=UPI003712B2ED
MTHHTGREPGSVAPARLDAGKPERLDAEKAVRLDAEKAASAVRPADVPVDLELHCAGRPAWRCAHDGEPFPCPTWRALPLDDSLRAVLLAAFTLFLRPAIRDLRGHPDGPTPPEIVRRFLWFLPVTDEEARAVALRYR